MDLGEAKAIGDVFVATNLDCDWICRRPPAIGARPLTRFFWGGFNPTKIDRKKVGTLILTSLLEVLEDLGSVDVHFLVEMGAAQN